MENKLPNALTEIFGQIELEDGYYAKRQTITQTMAKALLEKRDSRFQRGVKPRTKSFLREQMAAGQWIDDSVVTLGFVKEKESFYILNGQHRLTVLSEPKGKPMTVLLHILGFENEEGVMLYATTAVDANAQRSSIDQLNIAGIVENLTEKQRPLARALPPAVHLIWSRMKGTGGGTEKPMAMGMKARAIEDWLHYATQYLDVVRGTERETALLLRPYIAVGMVTFRSQPEMAAKFWKAVVTKESFLEGFWKDVLTGNPKDEIGPPFRTPQALVRATAGAFNLFVIGQSAVTWDAILDFIEETKKEKLDDWHEAPLLLYGSPYDGTRHRSYEPDATEPGLLSAHTKWSIPLPEPEAK